MRLFVYLYPYTFRNGFMELRVNELSRRSNFGVFAYFTEAYDAKVKSRY